MITEVTMHRKNALHILWRDHLDTPTPDSSAGGSDALFDYFSELMEWDTFIAGLVQSSLDHDEEGPVHNRVYGTLTGHQLITNAVAELESLMEQLDNYEPRNDQEAFYQQRYRHWSDRLLGMVRVLSASL